MIISTKKTETNSLFLFILLCYKEVRKETSQMIHVSSYCSGNLRSQDMYVFYLLLSLPLFSSSIPLMGCQDSLENQCYELESNETEVDSSSTIENPDPQNRLMDNLIVDLYSNKNRDSEAIDDGLRTWRIDRKSLVPILIGLAIKALAMIPLALTALSILGSIAIFLSKLSLAISAIMFLRRFFSHDYSTGGFFGLNPLGFPQPSYNDQSSKQRQMLIGKNNLRRYNYDDVMGNIDKYRANLKNYR